MLLPLSLFSSLHCSILSVWTQEIIGVHRQDCCSRSLSPSLSSFTHFHFWWMRHKILKIATLSSCSIFSEIQAILYNLAYFSHKGGLFHPHTSPERFPGTRVTDPCAAQDICTKAEATIYIFSSVNNLFTKYLSHKPRGILQFYFSQTIACRMETVNIVAILVSLRVTCHLIIIFVGKWLAHHRTKQRES